MSKRTVKILVTVCIIFLTIVLCMFLVDFNKVAEKNEPMFSIKKAEYGTSGIEYMGLGYKIYSIRDKGIVRFGNIFSTYENVMGGETND